MISQKGVGCRGYGYFILGHSVAEPITWCTDKMSGTQRQSKLQGGQNAGHFMGQGGQNANIIKTLYM